jgi:hypothetical protein
MCPLYIYPILYFMSFISFIMSFITLLPYLHCRRVSRKLFLFRCITDQCIITSTYHDFNVSCFSTSMLLIQSWPVRSVRRRIIYTCQQMRMSMNVLYCLAQYNSIHIRIYVRIPFSEFDNFFTQILPTTSSL